MNQKYTMERRKRKDNTATDNRTTFKKENALCLKKNA
jgi:hypothetical protein